MNRFKIQRKEPVYLGIVLIVAGIFLKRFVELTLVSDMQIFHVPDPAKADAFSQGAGSVEVLEARPRFFERQLRVP